MHNFEHLLQHILSESAALTADAQGAPRCAMRANSRSPAWSAWRYCCGCRPASSRPWTSIAMPSSTRPRAAAPAAEVGMRCKA